MNLEHRISSFSQLGNQILEEISRPRIEGEETDFQALLIKAQQHNPWFTQQHISLAFDNILSMLQQDKLEEWVTNYPNHQWNDSDLRVGVIMAGNIPLVGFHDFLSVLISGKYFIGKLSSNDMFLLPFLANMLIEIEPHFKNKIYFENHILKDFDAVIATGSNNSSRYFDYYFGKYPHIIRHNRNSVALLTGLETKEEKHDLAKDVFQYFGLGCRNVSKLMLPFGYDIPSLLDEFQYFDNIQQHNKYLNNYEYNKSLFLINKMPHFDNGFLLLVENPNIASPISVLHYEFYYPPLDDEIKRLSIANENIQCVLSNEKSVKNAVKFGESQSPSLMEYADNEDVMMFLEHLKSN